MQPETFIANMNGFSMDMQSKPELVAAYAEVMEAVAQLEREVQALLKANKQIK